MVPGRLDHHGALPRLSKPAGLIQKNRPFIRTDPDRDRAGGDGLAAGAFGGCIDLVQAKRTFHGRVHQGRQVGKG